MLLHYRKQISVILVVFLVCVPFAGLHAQAIDVNKVNNSVVSLGQKNSSSDKLMSHDSMDHCSSHLTTMMDKNCAASADSCQCFNSCCGVIMIPGLKNTAPIYVAQSFLGAKKSQSIPLLILPTEIKPPRKLV